MRGRAGGQASWPGCVSLAVACSEGSGGQGRWASLPNHLYSLCLGQGRRTGVCNRCLWGEAGGKAPSSTRFRSVWGREGSRVSMSGCLGVWAPSLILLSVGRGGGRGLRVYVSGLSWAGRGARLLPPNNPLHPRASAVCVCLRVRRWVESPGPNASAVRRVRRRVESPGPHTAPAPSGLWAVCEGGWTPLLVWVCGAHGFGSA